ncbi:YheT family hydrolase [candidate division KSB1 bacterium]
MPVISNSSYTPPLFFSNGHIQTVYPSMFRRIDRSIYTRERINTPDDDFLDLDWSRTGSARLAVISHGLEGNSHREYVVGMARALNAAGFDVLAWNFRGCGEEINRQLRFYHNGTIDDLHTVIQHAIVRHDYRDIVLVGFSLGGNLTLLYLSEASPFDIPAGIKGVVALSVPCDLEASSMQINRFVNRYYLRRFLRLLHNKIKLKMEIMPEKIDDRGYHTIRNFKDFDDRYTAPIHGFKDALDYWEKCSCKPHVHSIPVPTLIVNARNDPFLSEKCNPVDAAKHSSTVFLEMPESGGHVGFIEFNREGRYWSEKRAVEFFRSCL